MSESSSKIHNDQYAASSSRAQQPSPLSQRDAQNVLRLRVNRVCLVQQLNVDPVIDYLKREGILTETDVRFVLGGGSRPEKTRLLLDVLPAKDPSTQWYNKFRNSLSATSAVDSATARNHQILADFLDSTNVANLKSSSTTAQQQQQQPPLPPIEPGRKDFDHSDAASAGHRRRWKALRAAAKADLELMEAQLGGSDSRLSRLPPDLPEHFARTYAAWTAGGGAAARRERRCLERLRMADEFALRTARVEPERRLLLCFISPLHRLLCDLRRRHLAYKYLLADAPTLADAMAAAFADLAAGPAGRRLFTDGFWSRYAAAKLANLAGRIFDFLAGAGQFAACETVANALAEYLHRYGGECVEALLPIYRASVRLMEARLNNAQHQLADSASQTAQATAARINCLSFGRKVMDNQALLQAQIGRLLLDQGSLTSALGAFASAISNVDLNDTEAVFKILYHALHIYILNSNETKAEKLAVACVQHAHKFYKAQSPEYIKSLLNYVKFSNAFHQDDFGVEVAVNASLFAQLILGYQHPLLAEIQSHLALAHLLRLRHHEKRHQAAADATEPAAHVDAALTAVRMSASAYPPTGDHPNVAALMTNLTLAARLANPALLPAELTQAAVDCGKKAIEILSSSLGQQSLAAVQAKISLGQLLAIVRTAHSRQDAEILAEEAVASLADSQPARGHVMLKAKLELAKLYRDSGNPERAMVLAKEVIDLTESYGSYIRWLDEAYILFIELLSESGDSIGCNEITSQRQDWLSKHPMASTRGRSDWASLHDRPDKDFFRNFRAWGVERKEKVRQAAAAAAAAEANVATKKDRDKATESPKPEAPVDGISSEANEAPEVLMKLLLLGDSDVGKSSLLNRFVNDAFSENFMPTIGVDFSIARNEIKETKVKCQIWDTAGQERFRTITSSYYRGIAGALLVFDASNRDSFVNCERWLNELRSSAPDGVPVTLVANKSDKKTVVSKSEAEQFATSHGLELCWQVSAKSGLNVDETFRSLERRVLNGDNRPSGASNVQQAPTQLTSEKKQDSSNHGEQSYERLVKLVLVGDSGVGKSCLLRRFASKEFHESFVPTIGVDFSSVCETIDGTRVKSVIWDTAGQERFRSITSAYYRGCHGALLIFDATNPDSLESCESWLNDLRSHAPDGLQVALVANKSDMDVAVSRPQAEEFARRHGLELCWQVSAKSGLNVAETFRSLTRRVLSNDSSKSGSSQEQVSHEANNNAATSEVTREVAEKFSNEVVSKPMQPVITTAEPTPDFIIKLLIIGDTGVGKSCLTRRFADKEFDASLKAIPTIGVDFRIVNNDVDGSTVKCQIWDTAGQERFRAITNSYYGGISGALLVFDASNRDSFVNCERWLNELRCRAPDGVPVALVANKSDMDAAVSRSEAEEFARRHDLELCWQVSAKSGLNVDQAFMMLQSRCLVQKKLQGSQYVPKAASNAIALVGTSLDQLTADTDVLSATNFPKFFAEPEKNTQRVKVLLIGDEQVGKTTMIGRFLGKTLKETYQQTKEVDFATKNIEVDGQPVKCMIWDLPSNKSQASSQCYANSDCALLVVNSGSSFEGAEATLRDLQSKAPQAAVLVVLNETGSTSSEVAEGARLLADRYGLKFVAVNARTGENVHEAFAEAVRQANRNSEEDESALPAVIDEKPAVLVNVIVVGNAGVGKSSLLTSFTGEHDFKESYAPTIGASLRSRQIKVDGTPVQCQMWDTAGQERYRSLAAGYYSGCQCAMLVYDVTDRQSLRDCEAWLQRLRSNEAGLPADAPIALIGNKLDRRRLSDAPVVDSGIALARRHGLVWREATARDPDSASEAFLCLLRAVLQTLLPPTAAPASTRDESKKRKRKNEQKQQRQQQRKKQLEVGSREPAVLAVAFGAAALPELKVESSHPGEENEEAWTSDSSTSSSCSD